MDAGNVIPTLVAVVVVGFIIWKFTHRGGGSGTGSGGGGGGSSRDTQLK